MDFIVWMDYTSPEPEKSFGLLDEESSCYIELPAEWEGNLMLTDSAEGEEAVELHTVDEGKLVLTMRLVPSSESAAGLDPSGAWWHPARCRPGFRGRTWC